MFLGILGWSWEILGMGLFRRAVVRVDSHRVGRREESFLS
jgi:hypothetical protein